MNEEAFFIFSLAQGVVCILLYISILGSILARQNLSLDNKLLILYIQALCSENKIGELYRYNSKEQERLTSIVTLNQACPHAQSNLHK